MRAAQVQEHAVLAGDQEGTCIAVTRGVSVGSGLSLIDVQPLEFTGDERIAECSNQGVGRDEDSNAPLKDPSYRRYNR